MSKIWVPAGVDAGPKYLQEWSGNLKVAGNTWLAQVFVSPRDVRLYYARLYGFAWSYNSLCYLGLRHVNALWEPTGSDIEIAQASAYRPGTYGRNTWKRFYFQYPDLVRDQGYALVLRAKGFPSTYAFHWAYHEGEPSYTYGDCFVSYDAGLTWSKIEDRWLLFSTHTFPPVDPPPPPTPARPINPPPPPPQDHFLAISKFELPVVDGTEIYLTTDAPAHLWCRWTNKQPDIHQGTKIVRGLAKHTGARWCFVEWNSVEQNEPGDTLRHSFNLSPWPVCETRWWYFTGNQNGEISKSASPVFSYHYQGPPVAFEYWIEAKGNDLNYIRQKNGTEYWLPDYNTWLTAARWQYPGDPWYAYRSLIRWDISKIPPEHTVISADLYLWHDVHRTLGAPGANIHLKHITTMDPTNFPWQIIDPADWDTAETDIRDNWLTPATPEHEWKDFPVATHVQFHHGLGHQYFAVRLRADWEGPCEANCTTYDFEGNAAFPPGDRPDGFWDIRYPLLHVKTAPI